MLGLHINLMLLKKYKKVINSIKKFYGYKYFNLFTGKFNCG